MSPSEDFSTPTYAIVSESADLDTDGAEWALDTFLGTVRIRSDSERARVFVGIGPAADVDRYLDGVEHDVVTDLDRTSRSTTGVAGGAPAGAARRPDVLGRVGVGIGRADARLGARGRRLARRS